MKKRIKGLLSIWLALVLVCGMMALPVFAEEPVITVHFHNGKEIETGDRLSGDFFEFPTRLLPGGQIQPVGKLGQFQGKPGRVCREPGPEPVEGISGERLGQAGKLGKRTACHRAQTLRLVPRGLAQPVRQFGQRQIGLPPFLGLPLV